MDQRNQMTVTFRCPPELEPILPKPYPAVLGLPDWFKSLPQKAANTLSGVEGFTVKKCPPFIDAMIYGFMIPLICDLKVENGEFTWDHDMPGGGLSTFSRSPIDFHDPSQVAGTPFFEEDRFVIKFNNFWSVATPPGYSLLFTHPVNRPELPFTTITGLVDSDLYTDNIVHFPAHWHDLNFNGVLPKGTPVAQCIPVKRASWTLQAGTLSDDDAARIRNLSRAIGEESGIYRRQFRAGKR